MKIIKYGFGITEYGFWITEYGFEIIAYGIESIKWLNGTADCAQGVRDLHITSHGRLSVRPERHFSWVGQQREAAAGMMARQDRSSSAASARKKVGRL
jgi:hypothetical protein